MPRGSRITLFASYSHREIGPPNVKHAAFEHPGRTADCTHDWQQERRVAIGPKEYNEGMLSVAAAGLESPDAR